MDSSQVIIGHDLDGLIIDIEETKRGLIVVHFGVEIVGKVGKEAVAEATAYTPEDPEFQTRYKAFQRALYNDPRVNQAMPPISGSLEGIARLRQAGIPQAVITARNGPAAQFGREWLEAHGLGWLPYVAVGTEKGAKVAACREQRVRCYTDDDLPVLGPLEADGYVQGLYFFCSDPRETVSDASRIVKVETWPQLGDYLLSHYGL